MCRWAVLEWDLNRDHPLTSNQRGLSVIRWILVSKDCLRIVKIWTGGASLYIFGERTEEGL
jgi:hypothetical protein